MIYKYPAAVFVTRGYTGPDRYRTIRGIKLIWVLMFRPMDTSENPGSAPT